nr:MAG TPA: hypothetical protein [Caudoviricetes sp.]
MCPASGCVHFVRCSLCLIVIATRDIPSWEAAPHPG